MKRIVIALIWLVILLSISACAGGAGESNTSTPPTGNSNWDQMKWDQDNWA